MLSRLRARRSAVTFDVGSAGIRAFQIRARGPRLGLCDALRLEWPAAPQDEQGALTSAAVGRLARLVEQGRFSGRDIGVVASAPEIRFHTFRVPSQVLNEEPERVQAALKWEVARETRTEPQELEVRHWPLAPGHHQGLNVMAVSVATKRAVEWFDMFRQHGLHLRRLDVAPCAVARLAQCLWPPEPSELWGVLDLGHHHASLAVVVGTVPTYIRALSVSAGQWTRHLAGALDVSYDVAERLKCKYGTRPGERGARKLSGDAASLERLDAAALPGMLFGLLRGSLDQLVRDINRCFSYVLQNYADLNVSRLVLAGGGASLVGLPEYLSEQVGVRVTTLSAAAARDAEPSGNDLSGIAFGPAEAAALGGAILDLEAA